MEECVEADWVSVRPNVFEEKERHKLVFMVAWSLVEGRFALTCHDRTEQRRRWSLHCQDPGSGGPHPLGSGTTTTPRISPARRTEEVGSVCTPKGRHTVKNSGGKIGGPAGLNSTSESNDIILGSWDIVTAQAVEDIQALEPMEDIPGVPSFCADDGDERDDLEADPGGGGAGENFSWAGLFSFQDLRAAHLQLCAVNSDLEHCLPPFPEERSGGGGALWSVLFGTAGDHHASSQRETDALCYQVQVYLGHALDTCGWKILSQVLFAESSERHAEEYYESLNELRHKGYEDALERSKRRLQELLEKHRALDSMVDLLQLYTEEDQAFGDLLEATTQLYHYLLQPFRDMRELAMLRKQQIKISLETERLGPRRVDGLRKEDEEWTRKAHAAVLSIQDLTVKFFETTTRAQKAMYERMRADQKKLGRSSWVSAVERMERLQYATSKETLQLMRAKEICLEQRKHSLKEQMQSLQGGDDAMMRLDHMEALYYKLQLQLYDIQAEVLLCEELLLNAQLHSLRRHMNEYQDEVVYYDAYESPDAMEGAEDCVVAQTPPTDEELHVLQHRIRQLEARRGRITAKKTYLKNKKEICIVNHNQKLQQRQGSHCEDIDPLLAPQQRGDPDEDEEKGNARVSQERQRTLDRLRSFKQRYPGHVTLKSRLRLGQSHTKRRAGGAGAGRASEQSGTPGGRPSQQPGTQSASVQTDSASSLPPLSRPPSDAHGYESASLPPPELTARAEEGLGSRLPPFASMPLLSDLPPSATPPSHLSSGPPPPPPPPPPLLPYVGEDQQGEEGERDSRRSPVQRPAAGCESPSALQVAMAFSPQFFDSSQLLTARKKLRKTASMETSQWRRACSPMDEVLASLKRGSFHLRKAELRVLAPDPDDDESNNILAQIRQGVRLRKVRTRPDAAGGGRRAPGGLPRSADALTRSIHEALRRIKEASPDSDSDEDDEDSLPGTDWDN